MRVIETQRVSYYLQYQESVDAGTPRLETEQTFDRVAAWKMLENLGKTALPNSRKAREPRLKSAV